LDKITDLSLFRISQRCGKLRTLAVNYCERFSDSGFELLPALHKLVNLECRGCFISNHAASLIGKMESIRVLKFAECQRIVDWEKAAKNLNPDLTEVDFSVIKSVNNTGIKHLAFNCRYLISINISGCPDITDLSIQYISGVCHYLTFIDISGLPHVSNRSVKYLRKGCKLLKHLKMLYMQSVTKEGYEKAVKWFETVEWDQEDPPFWWEESYNRADKHIEMVDDVIPRGFSRMGIGRPTQLNHRLSLKAKLGLLTLRPKTAIGIEKESVEKPPPARRKLQTRHTFDGVTINIHYNGPRGDGSNKKRDSQLPTVPISRPSSRNSTKPRNSSRPSTARVSRQTRISVTPRPLTARASKV
jgi:hypothetical protein